MRFLLIEVELTKRARRKTCDVHSPLSLADIVPSRHPAHTTRRELGFRHTVILNLGILTMGGVLFGSPALPKTSSVEGRSSLGIMQNSPPTRCWVETDCGRGEVCHLSITITGAPALKLLQALKHTHYTRRAGSRWRRGHPTCDWKWCFIAPSRRKHSEPLG